MHRSGTSMVARLLNLCGLNLGSPELLMDPNEANSSGYFEHKGFLKVNEALLAHFGGAWADPPRVKKGWEHDPSLDILVHEAKMLINTFSGTSLWGWKEPRTTVLLPFWKSLLANLRFVICVRSPLEVARSLEKRDGFSIGAGVHLWGQYMRAAIQDTEGCPRILTLYEDYFSDPVDGIRRLVEFCGLRRPAEISLIEEAIDSELRHQTSETGELLNEGNIPAEHKLFYICLRALAHQDVPATSGSDRETRVSDNIGRLLRLMDEFHNQEKVAQLEAALADKDQQLGTLETLLRVKNQQMDLVQEHASRLQAFSDTVRQTLAYRIYSQLIKPFRSE
jgi:hypothetical protein